MRTIPDTQLGNVQPDEDARLESSDVKGDLFVCHGQIPPQAIQRVDQDSDEVHQIMQNGTSKAIGMLKGMIEALQKAGAAQISGDASYPIPEGRRAREYEHSFKRDAPGIRGVDTPDLPEQGKKWPEGSDDEGLDRPPQNLVNIEDTEAKAVREIMSRATSEAKKALAAAPRFSPGPFVSPPEKEYLKLIGYSDDEIESGGATMSPRVRAEFNKWLTSTIRKSITRF
jgi:hypothetical protein